MPFISHRFVFLVHLLCLSAYWLWKSQCHCVVWFDCWSFTLSTSLFFSLFFFLFWSCQPNSIFVSGATLSKLWKVSKPQKFYHFQPQFFKSISLSFLYTLYSLWTCHDAFVCKKSLIYLTKSCMTQTKQLSSFCSDNLLLKIK